MVLSSALSETSSRKYPLLLVEWALMYRYQEMIAHIPIASHPDPKTILVVGGGDGGVIREALKHKSVEKVTLVDIDEVSYHVLGSGIEADYRLSSEFPSNGSPRWPNATRTPESLSTLEMDSSSYPSTRTSTMSSLPTLLTLLDLPLLCSKLLTSSC
jgi:hypothetical protein